MSQFTNRQQRLISLVMNAPEPITGQELARVLGVSVRTVQSDIARINKPEMLIRSSNRGYSTAPTCAATFSPCGRETDEPADCASTPHRILQLLSCSNREWRVDDLSEELYISTPTLERYLRQIPAILAPYHLEIHRDRGLVRIEGAERQKRKLIGGLIAQEAGSAFTTSKRAAKLFKNMDIELVRSMTASVIEAAGCTVKQGYEDNLFASITIALYRMRTNAYIEEGTATTPQSAHVEQRIADELCRRYSTHFRIAPKDEDRAYLATLLRGQIEAKRQGITPNDAESNEAIASNSFVSDIESLVNDVLDAFLLHVDFSQSLYNFAMHVEALLHRASDAQIQDDGMLDNIKRRFPFVYEVALLVADRISRRYGIALSNGEVGFICIHMGFLLERTTAPDHMRIGLQCRDYHGTAARIRAGILEQCPQASVLDINEFSPNVPVDLLVTTQPPHASNAAYVEVSPFFTPDDRMELARALTACSQRKRNALTHDLFSTYLDGKLFFVEDSIETKREAIEFLGRHLERAGIARHGFTSSVLQREEMSSTCFFDLFAVPHALEMNATRTMVAVLISPQGVQWDDRRIHIVLMIAVRQDDRKEFMKLYDNIVKALWNDVTARRAAQATSIEEFLSCVIDA